MIQKYYPPDFDPSKIPRVKRAANHQFVVRMMMPMNVRCNSCGEFIYAGTKFNSRKETVTNEDYLGIKIFRFYFKCPCCKAECTIRTDPKNADYAAEMGVSRNFEPWREHQQAEALRDRLKDEEKEDAIKALEARTMNSRQELDVLDDLDEIKSMNARNAKITPEELLNFHAKIKANDTTQDEEPAVLPDEDEEYIKKVFTDQVRRLDDDKQEEIFNQRKKEILGDSAELAKPEPTTDKKENEQFVMPQVVAVKLVEKKKSKKRKSNGDSNSKSDKKKKPKTGGISLLADYGSD